jgi:hypothetical protein
MNTHRRGTIARTSLIGAAISVTLLSFASAAYAGRCRTVAQHWDGLVDVRSAPQNSIFNLIGTLPNGTVLDIIGERGNWLEIFAPNNQLGPNDQTGWVAADQTRRICFRDGRSRSSRDYDYNDSYDE